MDTIYLKVCSASEMQSSRSEKLSHTRYYVRMTNSRRRLDVTTEMQWGETPIWDQDYALFPAPSEGSSVKDLLTFHLHAVGLEKEFLVGTAAYDLGHLVAKGEEQETHHLPVVGNSTEKVAGYIKVMFRVGSPGTQEGSKTKTSSSSSSTTDEERSQSKSICRICNDDFGNDFYGHRKVCKGKKG